jgi:hypothetical protein
VLKLKEDGADMLAKGFDAGGAMVAALGDP